jgi:hypothetical protein
VCERVVAELEDGKRPETAALRRFANVVAEAHAEAPVDQRYTLRHYLGRVEHLLARAGAFEAADSFYRAKLELARYDYKFRFREFRDVSALFRAWTYGWWSFSSRFGTSGLRMVWTVFNVGFWFSVLYFILDVLTIQFAGDRAFVSPALASYGSYFIIGFEGLFPGTAAILANTFVAQVALAFENAVGAVLILSLISLVARRVWRGMG